jgi:F-type H+-transporting ATPase subunit epsilon
VKLEILTPSGAIELDVESVTAVDDSGSFGLMARHIDFISVLRQCILTYTSGGVQGYVVVDAGIIRVEDGRVTVATRQAIQGEDVEELRELLEGKFREREEKEATFMDLLSNMEKLLVDRMIKFERGGRA